MLTCTGVENVTQCQGVLITKCDAPGLRSVHVQASCFGNAPRVQCAVGVSPAKALLQGPGSALWWVFVLSGIRSGYLANAYPRIRRLTPSPVTFLLAHHPGPTVPQASILGSPGLSWAALCCCCVGVGVLLLSWSPSWVEMLQLLLGRSGVVVVCLF